MPADHHVFQNGHAMEQPDVLKGPGNAPFCHIIGLESFEALGGFSGRRNLYFTPGGVIDTGNTVENVVFPAPLGPMSAVICPFSMVMDTSSRL